MCSPPDASVSGVRNPDSAGSRDFSFETLHWGLMREREFWQLLEEVFGRTYGRALSRDQQLPALGNMTVVEALESGEEPRVVWNVLCDQMEVPDAKRWGRDHNAPPMPHRVA